MTALEVLRDALAHHLETPFEARIDVWGAIEECPAAEDYYERGSQPEHWGEKNDEIRRRLSAAIELAERDENEKAGR